MKTSVQRFAIGALAVVMVACGVWSIVGDCFSYMNARPLLFESNSVIEVPDTLPANVQPGPKEWPLLVAKEAQIAHPPEPYALEVSGVRDTGMIKLKVTAGSHEHAQALATWLGDAFVATLRESYADRGVPTERMLAGQQSLGVWENWDAQPESLWSLTFQFLVPSLLVLGGVVLFRMRRG